MAPTSTSSWRSTLITGEPSTAKAIADYNSARLSYVTAVQRNFEGQKLATLDKAIQAEVERQVAEKFYPNGGWKVDSVESIVGSTKLGQSILEKSIQVFLHRTTALYSAATPDEEVRTLVPSTKFTATLKIAREFFPWLVSSWPQIPRLYVVAKPSGEPLKLVIGVRARDKGPAWVLEALTFPQAEIANKNSAEGLAASDLVGDIVVLDGDAGGLPTVSDWKRRQSNAIGSVRAEEMKMTNRYGSDRAAWRVLVKLFTAAGGEARLQKVSVISERVRTKMGWPWLLGKQDAEGSGTIRWRAQPFAEDEQLNVAFRFKPLLGGEENITFTWINSMDATTRRSETLNCMCIDSGSRTSLQGNNDFATAAVHSFYLHRDYATQLLWHLASDDGPFDVSLGDAATCLLVRKSGFPDYQVEFDPNLGIVRSVHFTDHLEDGKPIQVRWVFGGYRTNSGGIIPMTRDVYYDGKPDWCYVVTNVQYATAVNDNETAKMENPQVPNEYRIKSDLLGYSIGKGYFSWRFESLAEFRDFVITSRQQNGTSIAYHIHVSLMGQNNIGATADLVLNYMLKNGAWVLNGVDDQGTYQQKY